MKSVSVYEAKTHLSQLLVEVERGEVVTITRSGKPVARLVPAQRAEARSAAPLRGLVLAVPADAFDPVSDAELAALVDGPLLPDAP